MPVICDRLVEESCEASIAFALPPLNEDHEPEYQRSPFTESNGDRHGSGHNRLNAKRAKEKDPTVDAVGKDPAQGSAEGLRNE